MNINSDILKHVMDVRGITLQQLADQSGVPFETLRNFYYNKINEPKASTILKLSQALDLSMNYLCGDLRYKDDEAELLKHYRSASARGKSVIQLFARIEADLSQQERAAGKYVIPCLIPVGVITDGIKYHSCDSIKVETTNSLAYLAIEITTNNFAPVYCMGDRILLEDRFPLPSERAVFMRDGCAYLREFAHTPNGYLLRCLNGRGNNLTLRRMDEIECVGTVIGVIRT